MGSWARLSTRRGVAATVAVIGALVLAGCWPAPGQGPDRRAHNPFEEAISPTTVASMEEAWATTLATWPVQAPVTSPGAVHVQAEGTLHTVAAADGTVLWDLPAFPEGQAPVVPAMSDPVVLGDRIAVGYGIGNLGGNWRAAWVDVADGEVGGDIGAGLVDSVRGDTAVLSSVAFGSGTPIAVYLGVVSLDGSGPEWSGLVDIRSFGPGGGRVPATLGETGVYHVGGGLLDTVIEDDPTVGNGIRMFPTSGPRTCSIPDQPFRMLCPDWATPLDGTTATSPVLGDGVVYTGTDAGTVYAVDTATGATLWTAAVGSAVTAPPALANGSLYVPTAADGLVVLAASGCGAATCSPAWTAVPGADASVQPAVAGGVVFVGARDGSAGGAVHAVDAAGCGAATCPSLWSADTGSPVTGAPAVSAGQVYVGTADGRLIAYALAEA